MHDGIGGVARREQHLEGGTPAARLGCKLPAVHVRHHHVGEQQLHLRDLVEHRQRIRGTVASQRSCEVVAAVKGRMSIDI